MKVLIADKIESSCIEALEAMGCVVRVEPDLAPLTMSAALEEFPARVLIVRSTKVPSAVMDAAPSLRLIVRAGAGFDTIDIVAAGSRGIGVCNCPGMNAVAVAELAMGLLLALDRRIPEQVAELRRGHWNKKRYAKGARGLKGRTLGVVGVGAIGKALIERSRAFEMDIIAWSRHMTPDRAAQLGVRDGGRDRAALLDLARQCDAVSLHVASTPETHHMIDAEFLAALPTGAMLVNTARGAIIDEAALREAIVSHGIRAGLDVYEDQPGAREADWDTPTAALVYGTHHSGASTDQAQQAVTDEVVRIIGIYRDEQRYEHCVNRDALAASGAVTREA